MCSQRWRFRYDLLGGVTEMPLFKCPNCQREGIIPLAFCEHFVLSVPYDAERAAFMAPCQDCDSSAALREPITWSYDRLRTYQDAPSTPDGKPGSRMQLLPSWLTRWLEHS